MKRILPAIAICISVSAASAQNKADIEVSYSYEFPNFKTAARESHNQYILRANTKESRFFSPRTEYVDSMQSTPEGKAKLNEITTNAYTSGKFDKIPRADGSYYVVKSATSDKMQCYETVGMEKLVSEEPMPRIDWQIEEDSRNILGYDCVKATTQYNGRVWNAWFAPDIPIQNGPWKLSGLPGLILEAESADGLYIFTATGIEKTGKDIGTVYLADQYEKMNRKEMLKAKRAFFDNPLGNINAQLSGKNMKITAQDEHGNKVDNGKRIFATREEVDFIETDY